MESAVVANVNKTLDLATIRFVGTTLNSEALLSRTSDMSRRELLNGILRGRMCIAEVATNTIHGFIQYVRKRVEKEEEKFAQLPQLELIRRLDREMETYCAHLALVRGPLIDKRDVYRINCYKIHCSEMAIKIYTRIHVLFGTKAFGYPLDFQTLILNKVAEGDSSVLRLSVIAEYLGTGVAATLFDREGFSWRHISTVFGAQLVDVLSSGGGRTGGLLKKIGVAEPTELTKSYLLNNMDTLSDGIIKKTIKTMSLPSRF